MQVDTEQALDAKAMSVFTDLLMHKSEAIRAMAARDIFDLRFVYCKILDDYYKVFHFFFKYFISIPLEGKKVALTLETVPLLVNLLKDEDGKVKSKSALALEAIAITTEGKFACIKEEAVENLVALISDSSSEARVNGLKAITCLAETPTAREQLIKHIQAVCYF